MGRLLAWICHVHLLNACVRFWAFFYIYVGYSVGHLVSLPMTAAFALCTHACSAYFIYGGRNKKLKKKETLYWKKHSLGSGLVFLIIDSY